MKTKLAASVALLAVLSIPSVYAQESTEKSDEASFVRKGFVGALAGPAIVTSTGGGTNFIYGGEVGLNIGQSQYAEGVIGLFVDTMTSSQTVSGIKVDGRGTFIAAEYTARKAFGTDLYFGARAGLGIRSATVSAGTTSVSASSTAFAFAPVVGYEQPIVSRVNLVLDASWMNFLGGTYTFPTATINYDAAAALTFQAGLSLNF